MRINKSNDGVMAERRLSLAEADAVAESCADAFSFDAYGDRNWKRSARMLAGRGFSAKAIEAILRSKWTRWADDCRAVRKGAASPVDLSKFLDAMVSRLPEERRAARLHASVAELVAETFEGGF